VSTSAAKAAPAPVPEAAPKAGPDPEQAPEKHGPLPKTFTVQLEASRRPAADEDSDEGGKKKKKKKKHKKDRVGGSCKPNLPGWSIFSPWLLLGKLVPLYEGFGVAHLPLC
jgi:hypothetical protein